MYIVLGFFSGIIGGMGIGGGAILIPALTFFMDVSQQQAQIINLLYFVPTGLVAIYKHSKEQQINFKAIKPLIFYGIIGAVIGSFIAVNIEGELLRKFFGGFLLIGGILELNKKTLEEKK